MSDNISDGGSGLEDPDRNINDNDESGSEYQDEDSASSVKSGPSRTSNDNKPTAKNKQKRSEGSRAAPQKFQSTKAIYNDAYRDLYNDTVEELANPFLSMTNVLPSSEIGAIFWTHLEKEVLFQKIASLGRDNIDGIAEAIQTKSAPEVRQYLTFLDQGRFEGNITSSLPVFSASDVPAAIEVSKHCEDVLEEFADGLAHYERKGDQRREKKRHGDYWLLTEDIAQEIELHPEISQGFQDEEHVTNQDDTDDSEKEATEDGGDEPMESVGTRSPSLDPGKQELDLDEDESQDDLQVPAAKLLDLPMWLRLSQLFMYQSPKSKENWTNLVNSSDETPSMYHTTFQDFHNLTISLTRRLVQATIFQTMTRLRARDKGHPTEAINASDVRAAVDILDLKSNRREFWAGVPRRHGLKVFERSTKFTKGQSRSGTELSLAEAEERLGVAQSSAPDRPASKDGVVETVEDDGQDESENDDEDILDPDVYYEDSELWTEASQNGDEEPQRQVDDQGPDMSDDDDDLAYQSQDNQPTHNNTRKKRSRKEEVERKFRKAHDAYLEALDQEMSRIQEVEIMNTLQIPPSTEIKDEEIEIPHQPATKMRLSDNANWRDEISFQPPWERGYENLQPEDFAEMQTRGERGRKRRRQAYEYLEREGLVNLNHSSTKSPVVRKEIRHNNDVVMEDAPDGQLNAIPQRRALEGLSKKSSSKASRKEGSYITPRVRSTVSPHGASTPALTQTTQDNHTGEETTHADPGKAAQDGVEEEQFANMTKEERKAARRKAERRAAREAKEAEAREAQIRQAEEEKAEEERKRAEERELIFARAKAAKEAAKEEERRLHEERIQANAERKQEERGLAKTTSQLSRKQRKEKKGKRPEESQDREMEDHQGETSAPATSQTKRATQSKGKKPKRQSGF